MSEDQKQWERDIQLRKTAETLGLLMLQSDIYATDPDVRDAVDNVLAVTMENHKTQISLKDTGEP